MVAIGGSLEVMVRQYHKTRSAGVNMAIRHVTPPQTVFLVRLSPQLHAALLFQPFESSRLATVSN